MRNCHSLAIVVVLIFAVGSSAAAQEYGMEDYGIQDTNYLFVSGEEFRCNLGPPTCMWMKLQNNFWRTETGGIAWLTAPVRLPSGSLITGMTFIYHDGNATEDIFLRLERYSYNLVLEVGATTQLGNTFQSNGLAGWASDYVDFDPDYTVVYYSSDSFTAGSYGLSVTVFGTSHYIRGVIIHWERQISPAPVSATFGDVSTGHLFFRHIEALVASGITAGCGGGNYCPDDPVTRGQMAVFLAKALGLHWAP